MRKIILAMMIVLNINFDAMADTNKSQSAVIPFIHYETRIIEMPSYNSDNDTLQSHARWSNWGRGIINDFGKANDINVSDIQHFVIKVKEAVCVGSASSSVRIWISVDASGKILGIGASGQSGIEVTFQCK